MRANHGAPYLALHRVDLQTALHARAASLGVGFRFGTRIRRVDFETGELVSEDGEAVRGDLVVAADGLWSACRAQFLPKDFEGVPRPTGDLAYRVVLTLDQIRDPELRDWVSKPSINIWIGHNSHVVGYSLRNGTEFNLVLITPDDLPDDVRRAAGSAEEMRALFKNWDPVLNRFLAVVESVKKWKLMHREILLRFTFDINVKLILISIRREGNAEVDPRLAKQPLRFRVSCLGGLLHHTTCLPIHLDISSNN